MYGDLVASIDEHPDGSPLLRPVMRGGTRIHPETLSELSTRAAAQLEALPERLRLPRPAPGPSPMRSPTPNRLTALAAVALPQCTEPRSDPGAQRGTHPDGSVSPPP